LFNAPAELPIQEEDKPNPNYEDDLDLIDPPDPEMDLAQALQVLSSSQCDQQNAIRKV